MIYLVIPLYRRVNAILAQSKKVQLNKPAKNGNINNNNCN